MPESPPIHEAIWLRFGQGLLAVLCAVLIATMIAQYPLPSWPLAALVAAYAVLLWRWPVLFLVVIPAVLPALDLGLWTGWQFIGEPDLFVLATVGTLILREWPAKVDLVPPGWLDVVLTGLIVVLAIAVAVGLASPLGYTGTSANPYLRPDNALLLAKGPAEALLLLPFIRQRQRTHADAAVWLGRGR